MQPPKLIKKSMSYSEEIGINNNSLNNNSITNNTIFFNKLARSSNS